MSEFTETPPDAGAETTATAAATAAPTPTPTPAPAPAQSSTRARAEARRRRILERSQNRMQAVSGGIVNPPKAKAVEKAAVTETVTETETEEVVADVSNDDEDEEPTFTDINATEISASVVVSASAVKETDESEAEAGDDAITVTEAAIAIAAATALAVAAEMKSPSPAKSSSTSARQLQMRRRRYRQKAAAAKEAKAAAVAVAGGEGEGKETEAPVSAAAAAVETPVVVAEEKPKPAVAVSAKPVAGSKSTEEKEKKKYLGVAKMRRKRLAEEKAKQEAALESKLDSDLHNSSTSSEDMAKLQAMQRKLKPTIALKPILFQLLTVVALFLVGFDVGVQNHAIVNQNVDFASASVSGENVVISNLAFVDHGIGALSLFGASKAPSGVESVVMASAAAGFKAEDIIIVQEEEEDEFGNTSAGNGAGTKKPAGAHQSTSSTSNIDPLFGVDFDKLTAGSGIFMMLARLAVSIHRSIMYLCYTMPLSFVSSLTSTPKRLIGSPPIWFLLAVLIRYLGKHVLAGGVEIMSLEEGLNLEAKMEEQFSGMSGGGGGDKKKPDLASSIADTNFVSMGTNFVKNFITTKFPKMALLVTVLKDAKNDMYVVLGGFFVGLVVPSAWVVASTTIASDEL